MLFSGQACFSPSVLPCYRRTWVKNGGTLTRSKDDFVKTKYFFCDGPSDPWLIPLRANKSLLVRHAAWIGKSFNEEFLMPVGPYVLDEHFDIAMILPIEFPDTPLSLKRPFGAMDQGSNLSDGSISGHRGHIVNVIHTEAGGPQALTYTQSKLKRPLHAEKDRDSSGEEEHRPKKRRKIRESSGSMPKSQDAAGKQISPEKMLDPKTKAPNVDENPRCPAPFVVLPEPRKNSKEVLKFTPTPPPPQSPPKAYTLRRFNLRGTTSPALVFSVAELLEAPRTEATLLDPKVPYFNQKFVCLSLGTAQDTGGRREM
ncbi:hypothetical protein BDN72DRAFT_626807 [Pluteus cervinus]|uniref:Uncharacterized protein n=1 Tax=Pluteus cervinus TaxID=181527 RepID=A0ACD3ATX3_9AGAR|nr:hypothetical protein BDN72DRAFT_626807 [Pluteus cervinus]